MAFLIKNIVFLIYISSKAFAFLHYTPLVSDNAKFVVFGNVTNFDDLLSTSLNHSEILREDEEDEDDDDDQYEKKLLMQEMKKLDQMDDFERKDDIHSPDKKDYDEIANDTRRVLREYTWWYKNWYGYSDDSDFKVQGHVEEEKLDMLGNCGLQFLIHARFKIREALKETRPFRGDKRYMLGYLFNRMRRITYEQRKVIHAAMNTYRFQHTRKLRSLLRLYQQVVRYDVDLTDLTRYIRRVFIKPAKFDSYAV